jgi:hypothetical protein
MYWSHGNFVDNVQVQHKLNRVTTYRSTVLERQ